jgi:hypothetical protein
MALVDYILENIEKKMKGERCVHFALEGEKANEVLFEAYKKAQKFSDKNNHFSYITKAITPSLFLSKILNNNTDTMENLLAQLDDKNSDRYFAFVQDFDAIISAIDPQHKLGGHLVSSPNLYLTVSSTSNPETVGMLGKINSPYWLDSYFLFRPVK